MTNNKIDEYIVTKILGFKKVETVEESPHNGDEFTVTDYIKDGVRIKGSIIDGILPSYSSSLKLSFKLLEELRENNTIALYKIFSPILHKDKTYAVYIKSWSEFDRAIMGESLHKELPKAICLAIIDHHKEIKRHALRTSK